MAAITPAEAKIRKAKKIEAALKREAEIKMLEADMAKALSDNDRTLFACLKSIRNSL